MGRIEDEIRDGVREHGYHVVIVPAEGDSPAYGFTLGLCKSHDHPELVLFGLDEGRQGGAIHELLDAAASEVVEGRRFEVGVEVGDLVDGYPIAVRGVDPSHHRTWLLFAERFHAGLTLRCVQLVWPDAQRRFPWDEGFDPRLAAQQPLLETPDRDAPDADALDGISTGDPI